MTTKRYIAECDQYRDRTVDTWPGVREALCFELGCLDAPSILPAGSMRAVDYPDELGYVVPRVVFR
jgi:hypothetical protein